MRNIKIIVEYDGTNYSGWQVQYGKASSGQVRNTVQGQLEAVIGKILQENIKLAAASRTDAGVHAAGQAANFKTANSTIKLNKLLRSINSMLPEDIAVSAISIARDNFSARYDAESKVYRYLILNQKSRIIKDRDYYWHLPYKIDWNRAKRTAKKLRGVHDFSGFSSSGSPRENTRCRIKNIRIKKEGRVYSITMEANFFLYRMARNIAGVLVDVGRGKLEENCVNKMLRTGRHSVECRTAPAKGLCLMRVKY